MYGRRKYLFSRIHVQYAHRVVFKVEFVLDVFSKLVSEMDSKLRVMKSMQEWNFDPFVRILKSRKVRNKDLFWLFHACFLDWVQTGWRSSHHRRCHCDIFALLYGNDPRKHGASILQATLQRFQHPHDRNLPCRAFIRGTF